VVRQQQAARKADWGIRSSLVSTYNRIRSSAPGRRILSAAAVLFAMGGFGVVLGTRTRSATTQTPVLSRPRTANSSMAERSENLSEQQLIPVATDLKILNSTDKVTGDNAIKSFPYVIQPKDTLRDLCMSMLGRYDNSVLSEIRELNPNLKNPNQLEVGQEVRLPISVPK
jgi:hypothetical protein